MSGMRQLQLSAGSGFLLESLFVQLIEELAVDFDGRGTFELETGDENVSKIDTHKSGRV